MDGMTHSIVGILSGVGLSAIDIKYSLGLGCLGLAIGCYAGALLPDIDTKSKISFMLGFSLPIKHRTITHSLLFAVLIGFIGCFLSYGLGIGLFIGVLTHLFLDFFTGYGVPLFYPIRKRKYRIRR